VVEQLNGNYEVKSEKLIPLWVRVKELINEMAVTVKWIPREENKMADFLVTMVRRGNSG
jgi:ribonuclease HI